MINLVFPNNGEPFPLPHPTKNFHFSSHLVTEKGTVLKNSMLSAMREGYDRPKMEDVFLTLFWIARFQFCWSLPIVFATHFWPPRHSSWKRELPVREYINYVGELAYLV